MHPDCLSLGCSLAEEGRGSCRKACSVQQSADRNMRIEFEAWAKDRGCDTDGAWSAWQGCWNLLYARGVDLPDGAKHG